ncbi:MAG: hypothetical protein ACJA1R_002397, partial [Flavobacteriales bacterium]
MRIQTIIALALTTLVWGCELEETCDPLLDPNCVLGGADVGSSDAGVDVGTDAVADIEECPGGCGDGECIEGACGYRYIVIQDSSLELNAPHPGSDIDAIELRSAGESYFAASPTDWFIDSGFSNDASEPSQVAGPPELPGEPFECDVDVDPEHWTSLASGYLVVEFGRPIRPGDQIVVYECPGRTDTYEVLVGLESRFDAGTF